MILDKPVYCYEDFRSSPGKRNVIIGASGMNINDVISFEESSGNNIFVFNTVEPLYRMSFDWLNDNLDSLEKSFSRFHDDLSRETFLAFINDKSGCINCADYDIRPLWRLWTSDQYFNDLYDVSKYETHSLIDCGAWIGDTAEAFLTFLNELGRTGQVYAFEPVPDNFRNLQHTAERLGNIECFNLAVGNVRQHVKFSSNSSQSHVSNASDNDNEVCAEVVPVDDVLEGKRVSIVKMDLEGSEENALNGMRKIIAENLPMLAVCVYHKIDDIIRLPDLIDSLVSSQSQRREAKYKFYIRHHSFSSYETVLYAVPD